ncbi:unnamed protein product, partial [Phaeothamnion confervicola]
LIETVVGWLARKGLAFILIMVILAIGLWIKGEVLEYEELRREHKTLSDGKPDIQKKIREYEKAAAERVEQLSKAPEGALDARIKAIDLEVQQKSLKQADDGISVLVSTPLGQAYIEHLRRDIEIKLLRQERDHLVRTRSSLQVLRNGKEELEKLRQARVRANTAYRQNLSDQDRLKQAHPVAIRIFGTDSYGGLKALQGAQTHLAEDDQRTYAAHEAQRKLIEAAKNAKSKFEFQSTQVAEALRPLDEAIQDRKGRMFSSMYSRVVDKLQDAAKPALLVLLSIILVPVGIKLVFYFVLAPFVQRRPPTCLMPSVSGSIDPVPGPEASVGRPRYSAVSQSITIDAGQEVLIHPEFLQSSSVGGQKDTKWLLDWRFPLSSLAAGLTALTRIRADRPDSVVVSATKDPFSEIGVLSLPEGAAIVFQPHSLVGVVCKLERPLRITSHWRVLSLHAWMTLQLRYLVFHGPVILIVKGCRGVRVERAEAGRQINQAATLGFSANLKYATARCETFASYFMGKQELFNDRFAGDAGFYVYEEMPGLGRKSGIRGRGLEGFTDSLLKVFGL